MTSASIPVVPCFMPVESGTALSKELFAQREHAHAFHLHTEVKTHRLRRQTGNLLLLCNGMCRMIGLLFCSRLETGRCFILPLLQNFNDLAVTCVSLVFSGSTRKTTSWKRSPRPCSDLWQPADVSTRAALRVTGSHRPTRKTTA